MVDPNNVPLTVDYNSNLCGSCHQSCHGLCGENHHPQIEQWSTSKHSAALFDLWGDPTAADSCLQCHSTDYRLASEGSKPSLWSASSNVECVACHSPHGGPNVGQLRKPPKLLCAECHTMGSAEPGEPAAQPQTEVLHGTGGHRLNGSSIDGPYTQHWWGIANECTVCHVHMEPYGGPEHPVDSGHTFLPSMRACQPCHSETVATLLTAMTREEIECRLAAVAPYFTPGDPLYLDPEMLPPPELPQYNAAAFDYQMVQLDRSFGAHNADYARALLSQTEEYLGIPPWSLRQPNGPYHWFLKLLPTDRPDGEVRR
jgi:predicted CXXCH cytochrome family protein